MFKLVLLLIGGIIVGDRSAAYLADARLIETNAFFSERYNLVETPLTDKVFQLCRTDSIFFIYRYRTCFSSIGRHRDGSPISYSFVYVKPLPRISLWRIFFGEKEYFGNSSSTGKVLFQITPKQ